MATKARRTKSVPPLLKHLQKHFGSDPGTLPVVERQFGSHDRPNIHLALEQM